ncbi:trace amine-associated receptor 1-like [Diadema setosum]|uniref:trace amine-associated receptor 1-like n=1 Tax=Diadema setosum TaxID=31175 RepID=UPI003B3A6C15
MDSVDTRPVNITEITPLNTALLLTCLIPVVVCSVVGNSLVVFAIYRHHRLWTPTFFIIASLAVADFFNGLVGIPLYLYFNLSSATRCESFEELVFTAPLVAVTSVSIFHITIVSVDRYIAVTRPLRYATLVTTRRVQVVIVFSWISVGTYLLTYLYVLHDSKIAVMISIKCPGRYFEDPFLRALHLGTLINLSIALFTVAAINVRILHIVFKQSRVIFQANEAFGRNQENRELLIKNFKAAQTISIVVFIYVMCCVPSQIPVGLGLVSDYHQPVLAQVLLISLGVGSAVNPLIYGYRDRLFREKLSDLRRRLTALIL